jgi:hypothetical protein
MPFRAKWSDAQRKAILDACTRYGFSAQRAYEAANDGSLPGTGQRLDPFPIALATVREYVTKERRRLRAMEEMSADPAAVMHEEAQALAVAVRRARIRVTTKQGVPTPEEITALAKAAREVHALLKALDPKPSRNGPTRPVETPESAPDEPERAPDFLDELASNGSSKNRPQ